MKKVLLVAGFACLILAAAIALCPKDQHAALAGVYKAMSNVRSVHFVGWRHDGEGAGRFECWRADGKLKIVREDGEDIADNGKTCTTIVRRDGLHYAKIEAASPGLGAMEEYMGLKAVRRYLSMDPGISAHYSKSVGSDGRRLMVARLNSSQGMCVITSDAITGLLVKTEYYGKAGLVLRTDNYEYNSAISDSDFSVAVPDDIPVIDATVSPTQQELEHHKEQAEKLGKLRGACAFIHGEEAGTYEAKFHPGFRFLVVGKDTTVAYLPYENSYRVVGSVIAYDTGDSGFQRLVKDDDIKLPGEPTIEKVLLRNGRPGSFCMLQDEDFYQWLFRWVNVGRTPLTVTYNTCTGQYSIHGTAKLAPLGLLYKDEAVEMRGSNDLMPKVLEAKKLDWASLPPGEIRQIEAQLAVERRLAEIESHKDAQGYAIIDGARHEGFTSPRLFPNQIEYPLYGDLLEGAHGARTGAGAGPRYEPRMGIGLELAGPTPIGYYLVIPTKKEIYIVGTIRILPSGRIVKNGLIRNDGTVISSEK